MSGPPPNPLIPDDQPIQPEPGSLGEFAETIVDADGELDADTLDEPEES